MTTQTGIGPRIVTTMPDGVDGITYATLGNDWGNALIMPDMDLIVVICRVSVGLEGKVRFWKDGVPSMALPLFVGTNVFDAFGKYRYDKVEFKNATSGQNAQIIGIVQGI